MGWNHPSLAERSLSLSFGLNFRFSLYPFSSVSGVALFLRSGTQHGLTTSLAVAGTGFAFGASRSTPRQQLIDRCLGLDVPVAAVVQTLILLFLKILMDSFSFLFSSLISESIFWIVCLKLIQKYLINVFRNLGSRTAFNFNILLAKNS